MPVDYSRDFYQWTQETAQALRERRFDDVDLEAAAEEIESLGRSDRRELGNRLAQLMMHLLKCQAQVERRTRSWKSSIQVQRDDIAELLEDSPSLRAQMPELIRRAYKKAVQMAIRDTGLPASTFPARCPFGPDVIESPPEEQGGQNQITDIGKS
jgi:hypothetical protein